MAATRVVPGINVRSPWSQLLVDGVKTVETRGYGLPAQYVGVPLALIETFGPAAKQRGQKSRIIGLITFGESFQYTSKNAWAGDRKRHRVPDDDPAFGFRASEPKFGWPVVQVEKFAVPQEAPPSKGIVFTKICKIQDY